jgi:aryl-alcohol dehydrogenase-like predicted oxidoreductase
VPIEQAEFGRTGHQSSRVIFGGAALAQVSQRVADQTLDLLLAHGVNHLDVASDYGEAEVRIRPWLQREPGRFFLATASSAAAVACGRVRGKPSRMYPPQAAASRTAGVSTSSTIWSGTRSPRA